MIINKPEYESIMIGDQALELRKIDAQIVSDFAKRFRNQPLTDFADYVKENKLPSTVYNEFSMNHFRHPQDDLVIFNNYMQTEKGSQFLFYLMLKSNPDVDEKYVNEMELTEAESETLVNILQNQLDALSKKK